MPAFQTKNLAVEHHPDGVALLRIDVPERPVNVFSRQVLADLDAALQYVAGDASVRLLVLRSGKVSGFMAGADLNELAAIESPEAARALSELGQNVFDRLAGLPQPTVALIHGPCLGGGLEFALACDYRLVLDTAKTQFGLPEVELGLVPAWGGTQRLPRQIGLERALHLIVGGRRLDARQAARWGLVDRVAATEPELAAVLSLFTFDASRAVKRPQKRLPLRTWRQRFLESTSFARSLVCRGAERILKRRVPDDMPAPWEAVRAVRTGVEDGMEAGLKFEREAVSRLATSNACRHLIHLFLEREETRKRLPASTAPAEEIKRVAIVGAGTMGAGIAQLAALRGFEVTVQEVNAQALEAGIERIKALFEKAVQHRLLSGDAMVRTLGSIRQTTSWEGFGDADLVVEAVIEDLPLKQGVFRQLEQRTRPTAVLATNTSSLLVAALQQGLQHPERLTGLHFFNPVHKMPLVEVVRAPQSADRAVSLSRQWAAALGKTPVEVKDSPGFVVNRVLMPYVNEAVELLAEGMPTERIDHLMRRFGMPMGPLELLDQVGLDVAAHIARSVAPVFGDRFRENTIFERLREHGWLGQKSGAGFYVYGGGKKKVNQSAVSLSGPADERGREFLKALPPAVQMQNARDRMVLVMVNEAAACLAENLAASSDLIDLAVVLGTGWAPHRGGPLRYGRDRGFREIIRMLEELSQRLGKRFEPSAGLRELAEAAGLK